MRSYEIEDLAQPSTNGLMISRAYTLNDHQLNSPTPTLPTSTMSTPSVGTPQPSFSDTWFLQMVRDRHSKIPDRNIRRALEYTVQRLYDEVEDNMNMQHNQNHN